MICDVAHEKVPNGENEVISTVVQRTCQGTKQNKNQLKICSSFRDIEFLLEKSKPGNFFKKSRKLIFNILQKMCIIYI